jgi:excinuclease UvrABC nuclease subunit
MINPSSIDLKTLPWLPLEEKTAFPKQAAIYFAIDSLGCVQYIGRSVNVRTRWCTHHKYSQLNSIDNIRIEYLFVDIPKLLPQIEEALAA